MSQEPVVEKLQQQHLIHGGHKKLKKVTEGHKMRLVILLMDVRKEIEVETENKYTQYK